MRCASRRPCATKARLFEGPSQVAAGGEGPATGAAPRPTGVVRQALIEATRAERRGRGPEQWPSSPVGGWICGNAALDLFVSSLVGG